MHLLHSVMQMAAGCTAIVINVDRKVLGYLPVNFETLVISGEDSFNHHISCSVSEQSSRFLDLIV